MPGWWPRDLVVVERVEERARLGHRVLHLVEVVAPELGERERGQRADADHASHAHASAARAATAIAAQSASKK